MLQQLWTSTIGSTHDAVALALGLAVSGFALARTRLDPVEAVMLAIILLLVVLVI